MEYADHEIYLESFSEEGNSFRDLFDGKLRTEDGYVFCINKCVLATRSRYFYVVFCEVDITRTDILIPGIKGNVLQKILSYLYTDSIDLTQNNVADILLMSDYLLLDDLVLRCEVYTRHNMLSSNCLQIFITGYFTNRKDIFSHSFRYVRAYFKHIVSDMNSEIEEIPPGALKQLLHHGNLGGRSETIVWDLIVRWVEADKSHRQTYVPDLIMYLKVINIDEAFATNIFNHDIVAKNSCCEKIIELKTSRFCNNNIDIFQTYFRVHCESSLKGDNYHEVPSRLYVIFQFYERGNNNLYITYDENINIWRKVADEDINSPFIIASFRECIYVIRYGRESSFRSFNVIRKEWVDIQIPEDISFVSVVLKHQGVIYFLSCGSQDIGNNSRAFVYHPDVNTWNEIESIIPVNRASASGLGNHIYVLGYSLKEMVHYSIFQVYDIVSKTWRILSFDDSHYVETSLICHCNRLYVIALKHFLTFTDRLNLWGKIQAKEYDFELNRWNTLPDPIFTCQYVESVNLNDQLIIYATYIGPPNIPPPWPLRLNNCTNEWESFEESTSFRNIHKYRIFAIEDQDTIEIITEQNRRLFSEFEDSPFN